MIVTRSTVQKHIPGKAKARARWAEIAASSERFFYARVKLLNVALPIEVESIVANMSDTAPLVIDVNKGYGATAAYTPSVIVASGGATRRKALAAGNLFAMAWVGEKALQAAGVGVIDGVTVDELQQKVSAALRDKFKTVGTDPYSFDGPYIQQLYPFDNYVIYNLGGQSYRISYALDTVERTVRLTGVPEDVAQEYVVQAGVDTANALAPMSDYKAFDRRGMAPYVPLGVRVDPTLVLPSLFTVSLGARNSELRNPAYGPGFLNVDDVVAAYQAQVRNGYHKPVLPPTAPIPGVRMLFAKEIKARGVVSPADLIHWASTLDITKLLVKTSISAAGMNKALFAINKMHQHMQQAQDAAKVGNAHGFAKHEAVAQHAGKAFNAFKVGNDKAGNKHLAKAKGIVMGKKPVPVGNIDTITAGGPGSGPRPGETRNGGHVNDAHDDGNHNFEDANEGKADPYGYVHSATARAATSKVATDNGFSDVTEPYMKARGFQDFSNGKHKISVHPDGSWTHSSNAVYFQHFGNSPDDLKKESFK